MKILGKTHKKRGFTLLEMIIVLIIMGILLMATMALSGDQIQKVKDKTVKESILAEMQSRYSRNLGSSSFGGIIYNHLDIELSTGSNGIFFYYYTGSKDESFFTGHFVDRFEIKYMTPDYDGSVAVGHGSLGTVNLSYTPYSISCEIGTGEDLYDEMFIVTRVNDSRDYCFEIRQNNCRFLELSESNCDNLKSLAGING